MKIKREKIEIKKETLKERYEEVKNADRHEIERVRHDCRNTYTCNMYRYTFVEGTNYDSGGGWLCIYVYISTTLLFLYSAYKLKDKVTLESLLYFEKFVIKMKLKEYNS